MANHLARVRRERGWTKAQLVRALREAAARRRERLVGDESLNRRIAAWENKGAAVGEFYRELLCDAYRLSAVELGLVETPVDIEPAVEPVAEQLVERLAVSRLDSGLVALLGDHTQSIRMLDRRLGGAVIYPQTAAHVEQIQSLVQHALPGTHREAAAEQLSQAAALAGWQALDMGRAADAWRLHEIATAAGRESAEVSGLAYAQAQQAYVLLDAGRADDALALIQAGRRLAGARVSPVLRAWLSAAEGEALAALGDRSGTLHALDAAVDVLPDHPADDALPYLMLGAGHIARWRGHCLARLGDADAIDDLQRALEAMGEGRYGRAEVSLRVDLALAFQARGELVASRRHAQLAADHATRTGSTRQRQRIATLLDA